MYTFIEAVRQKICTIPNQVSQVANKMIEVMKWNWSTHFNVSNITTLAISVVYDKTMPTASTTGELELEFAPTIHIIYVC